MYLHSETFQLIRKTSVILSFIMIFLLVCGSGIAQPRPLKVNVVVIPPYSTRISDYINTPNKIIVTITNTSAGPAGKAYNFYLLGTMSCDAGMSIATDPNYLPTRSISIQPGQVYKLTQSDIQEMYDVNHLIYNGISQQQILQDGGFPEGYYTICVSAYDYQTRLKLSDDAPSGCKSFPVTNLETPIIQKPICGDTVWDPQQLVNFTWSPCAGAPPTTMYRLRIVELLSGNQVPPDAFKTTPPNPFFEATTQAPVFLYTSAFPPMTENRTYAFAIQAFDTKGQAAFKNGGWSEICYFVYKKAKKQIGGGVTIVKNPGPKPKLFNVATLSGKIDYKFPASGEQHPMKNINLSLHVVYVIKNATAISGSGQTTQGGEIVFDPISQGFSNQKTIAHDNMQLRATATTDNSGNFNFSTTIDPEEQFGLIQEGFAASMSITYPPTPVEIGPVIGGIDPRVIPGWDGLIDNILLENNGFKYENLIENSGGKSFAGFELGSMTWSGFNLAGTFAGKEFANIVKDEIGLKFNNKGYNNAGGQGPQGGQTQVMSLSGHNQNLGSVKGDLYKYLRVVVDNDYYNSPDDDFLLQTGTDLIAPSTLVGLVNTYNLTVEVRSGDTPDQAAGTNSAMANVKVEVGRIAPIPEDVPFEEGQNLKRKDFMQIAPSCSLISTGFTGASPKGLVKFMDLVSNKGPIDMYELTTNTGKKEGVYNYLPDYQTFTRGIKPSFNSQFTPDEFSIKVELDPDYPRIAGRVMYKNYAVQGASCSTNISNQEVYTDKDGYFEITGLDVINDDATLLIKKYGYEDKLITGIGKLQTGGQYYNPGIELIPWGYITGSIEDKDGNPIEAEVQIDSLPFHQTSTGYSILVPASQKFKFRAPSGIRTLHIVPVSPAFMDGKYTVTVDKTPDSQPPQDLGTFKMTKNMHRIRIFAYHEEYSGVQTLPKKVGVGDCWIDLDGFKKKTGNTGYAEFEVSSPATEFHVQVIPPDAAPYYVRVEGTVTNTPSKMFKDYSFALKTGKTITGIVKSSPGMEGVVGARVFVEESNSNPYLSTKTGSNGFYSLHGIPEYLTKVTISAVKTDSLISYVGESKEANISGPDPNVNLTLKIVNEIDLSRILGFPLEATDYQKQPDGTALLSGHIQPLNNMHFVLLNYGTRLDFYKVKIKKSNQLNAKGIPYAEPAEGFLKTDNHLLELRYHNAFRINQLPAGSGPIKKVEKLSITKGSDGNGIIKGRAHLLKNSFQFPSALIDYDESNAFYLYDGVSGSQNVITMAGQGSGIPVSRFGLSSFGGNDMSLKFSGFTSTARSSGSYLKNDSIVLDLKVKANLKGSIQTTMDIGKVRMTASVINPVEVNQPLDISLGEKWKIHVDKLTWNSSQNGFSGKNPSLKTGFATIPVKNFKLKPEDIILEGFTISNLKIGNTSPVNISNEAECLFYFDPVAGEAGKPHYVIKIIGQDAKKTIATLSGLPGTQPSAKLDIGSIQVLDNDEQLYAGLENSGELLFYDVFHLKVNQITGRQNSFTLTGIYNLDLPRIPNYNRASLNFFRDRSSQVVMNMDPLPLEFSGPADVRFKANQVEFADTLFPGNFQCKGKLIFTDQGITKTLDALLVRETNQGYVKIFPENQQFVLGSGGSNAVRMTELNGLMQANKADWDFFWFQGKLANAKNATQPGQTSKFFVKGSINSEGNSISADNLTTPLGDVKLTYDLKNNILHGSLVMKDYPLCGFGANGAADIEFGSNGWYLAGSVQLMVDPIIIQQISAGLIFGSISPIPQSAKNTVLMNARNKEWPSEIGFQLKGFFFTGYKSIFPPVSVSVGFSLAGYYVGYKVSAEAGVDTRFWMNFLPNSYEMGFGIMMLGNANVYLGQYSGAICPYITGSQFIGFGINSGTYNFSTKKFKVHGQGFVGMSLEAGMCFGPFCNGCISTTLSKTLNCDVWIENQPTSVDFSIDLK